MVSRKVLTILLIGVCAGMLFGCGSEEKDIPAEQDEAAVSEEQIPEMSAIDSDKIVASVYGMAPSYEKNYPDIASLAEAADGSGIS